MGDIKSAKLKWEVNGKEKTDLSLEYTDTSMETVVLVESELIEAVKRINDKVKKKLGI